jgi:hypothetical protein
MGPGRRRRRGTLTQRVSRSCFLAWGATRRARPSSPSFAQDGQRTAGWPSPRSPLSGRGHNPLHKARRVVYPHSVLVCLLSFQGRSWTLGRGRRPRQHRRFPPLTTSSPPRSCSPGSGSSLWTLSSARSCRGRRRRLASPSTGTAPPFRTPYTPLPAGRFLYGVACCTVGGRALWTGCAFQLGGSVDAGAPRVPRRAAREALWPAKTGSLVRRLAFWVG